MQVAKAKTAKLVRLLLDRVAQIPGTTALQVSLCSEIREWSAAEKRTFLRQRVETRLAALHLDVRDFQPALALITSCFTSILPVPLPDEDDLSLDHSVVESVLLG